MTLGSPTLLETPETPPQAAVEEAEKQRQPAAARAGNRPAGGRRARSRAETQDPSAQPPQGGDDKPKKPRNRRHGRPR